MTWHLGSEPPRGGNFLTRWLGRLVFSAFGWKIEGEFPNREKAIVALVPHSPDIDSSSRSLYMGHRHEGLISR